MKTKVILFVLVCLASLLTSCASLGTGGTTPSADVVAAAVQPVAKTIVIFALNKNPGYGAALLALADGADAALTGTDLTPESIKVFVETLSRKYQLDPATALIIASGIDDLAKFYQRTYGKQVVNATDPKVREILTAFSAGLRDGVNFYRILNAGRSTATPFTGGSYSATFELGP